MGSIDEIKKQSFNDRFNFLMNNRMIMGMFRYGPRLAKKLHPYYINSAKRRIEIYMETGNTESLIDAANFLRMEFETPLHPEAHFQSIDDGEHSYHIK
jgi:hypothetical protein